MLAGDLLICEYGKRPQLGDIVIMPLGKKSGRYMICRIYSLTHDKDSHSLEVSNQYPIPEDLLDKKLGQRLNWTPLALGEETEGYLLQKAEKEAVPMASVPPESAVTTVLTLK